MLSYTVRRLDGSYPWVFMSGHKDAIFLFFSLKCWLIRKIYCPWFFKKYYLYVYVWVCMYMYACVVLGGDTRTLELQCCELPCGYWEGQQVLLSA